MRKVTYRQVYMSTLQEEMYERHALYKGENAGTR